MDINCLILGILLTLVCYSSALKSSEDKDIDYKNLLSLASTTEKMYAEMNERPSYYQTGDEYGQIKDGHRLWELKRMVNKMERRRPRRNILGILKDSVNNNLSNLLLHALDEDPPSDYKFKGSLWNYPRERSHKQSNVERVDPMMKWVGIGK